MDSSAAGVHPQRRTWWVGRVLEKEKNSNVAATATGNAASLLSGAAKSSET